MQQLVGLAIRRRASHNRGRLHIDRQTSLVHRMLLGPFTVILMLVSYFSCYARGIGQVLCVTGGIRPLIGILNPQAILRLVYFCDYVFSLSF